MRVVFAGTPPFAATALEAILAAGHEVPLVLTQPDRPAGRGLKLKPSAVAQAASRHSIPLDKPPTLKAADALDRLRAARPEVMVVAAYGLILPPAALQIPPRGCLNIHASLLPRWRGAAPIQRALLEGDSVTGVSIMQMESGLDTGPVLLDRTVEIGPRETAGTLIATLSQVGAETIVAALARLDELTPQPQDDAKATYAAKVSKAEARLDWSRSAQELARRVRAFDPVPGAEAIVAGETLKVWSAEPVRDAQGAPGSILRAEGGELVVACGSGALRLMELQRAGGRKMAVADFLRGRDLRTAENPK